MLQTMKPGSVIVDLAAERGGNVEGTVPGKTVEVGVRSWGRSISRATVPVNASSLYAKNLLAFLELMIDKKDKSLKVNWDDEIIKGTLVAKDGRHRPSEPRSANRRLRAPCNRLLTLSRLDRSRSRVSGRALAGGRRRRGRSRRSTASWCS